jgi:hypothetical protein
MEIVKTISQNKNLLRKKFKNIRDILQGKLIKDDLMQRRINDEYINKLISFNLVTYVKNMKKTDLSVYTIFK